MENTRQIRDFIFYLSGSAVLALIAIVKLPVFTSYFSPADFGLFSLVSITYTYLSVALYNWINSCIYRYYHEYSGRGQLPGLFSNIIFLFLTASIILFVITVVWYSLASAVPVKNLVIPAFCFLFTNQIFNMILVVFKLQGKSMNYNLYQVIQAAGSFGLILLLVFRAGMQIESLFTGQIVINILLLVFLFVKNPEMVKSLSFRFISRETTGKLLQYGFIGFISAAGIFILISSDRYIIALYDDISHVGIYNQVYQVGQVSVYFLVTVFFNSITPGFNKLLTHYRPENARPLQDYVNAFVLLVLPVAFYVALFSEKVSEFLLGEPFRQGYTMIPWIVMSSFIYGLTLFNETKMKFENHFKQVVWGVGIACALNVALNFILIPRLGYISAAFSTFIAYLFLFIYYYIKDDFAFFKDTRLIKIIITTALIFFLQGMADMFIRNIMDADLDKWFTLVEATVFFAMYAGIMIKMKFLQINIRQDQLFP